MSKVQPNIHEQLMPLDFRNAEFDDNLEFFRVNRRDIYEKITNLTPRNYRLCTNNDGSPNIAFMPSQKLVYPTTAEEIEANDRRKVSKMARHVVMPADHIGRSSQLVKDLSPIQTKAYERLLDSSILKIEEHAQANGTASPQVTRQDPNYLPYIRVYGVGLGTHLYQIVQNYDVLFLSIIEPDAELFYTSLFIISWRQLYAFFSASGKELHLHVGDTPEAARASEDKFIASTFPYITSNFARLTLFDSSSTIARLITTERENDSLLSNRLTSGWYEDQKIGLYNGLLNIRTKAPIYTGEKADHFIRMFIVGSGPSLENSLATIKKYADDALVLACGSALGPLLEAGIIPDYHVWQERILLSDFLKSIPDKATLNKICLLKLNVVSPQSDRLYKKAYVFQKANDPGSSLLEPDFPTVQGVNPTVTNAGVAFAVELEADEIYLFGADYGKPIGQTAWHSQNKVYDLGHLPVDYDNSEKFEIEGNFGRKVLTTSILRWSLEVTCFLVAQAQQIKWFNIGEGALIEGAQGIEAASFPNLKKKPFDKIAATRALEKCFSQDYDPSRVQEEFRGTHRNCINDYLLKLSLLSKAEPTSRSEIVDLLRSLYHEVDAGRAQPGFMPNPLLSGGIKKLILNIYLQVTLADSDESAVNFYTQATQILERYFEEICEDLDNLFLSALNDIDLWH